MRTQPSLTHYGFMFWCALVSWSCLSTSSTPPTDAPARNQASNRATAEYLETIGTWGAVFLGHAPVEDVTTHISDEALLAYATAPYAKGEMEHRRVVLGRHNGTRVVADYPCSDACPMHTVRIVRYDVGHLDDCSEVGGELRRMTVPISISAGKREFCFPKVLASNWWAYLMRSGFQRCRVACRLEARRSKYLAAGEPPLLRMSVPSANEGKRAAHRFLQKLGAGDPLQSLVGLPFVFGSSNKKQTCERTIAYINHVTSWQSCLQQSWSMLEDLRHGIDGEVEEAAYDDLPQYARAIFPQDNAARFVRAWHNGDGISYAFVVRLERRRGLAAVPGLAVDQEFLE